MLNLLQRENLIQYDTWRSEVDEIGGAILIDKDISWTSFDVVAKMRGTIKLKKIGHAGTLDPLATGLLIVCCGKYTKKILEFQGLEKEYRATLKLGATTVSEDSEHPEQNVCDTTHLEDDVIIAAVESFVGMYNQLPPMFSALKYGGKKLYDFARKNRVVPRETREVEVTYFRDIVVHNPYVSFTVACSKGMYVRSLARDIGVKLEVGAYLTELRRTKIGTYSVNDAYTIEQLSSVASAYHGANSNTVEQPLH